ncbi:MAG: hypothetical protein E7B26_12060, partial [Cutibacterium avidum]|nr:hypothetical protein [Cutibacterium avidum]
EDLLAMTVDERARAGLFLSMQYPVEVPGVSVANTVNRYMTDPEHGLMLITHYTRILRYVKPTQVHVYVDGRVAATGGPELGEELEAEGYEKYVSAVKANS